MNISNPRRIHALFFFFQKIHFHASWHISLSYLEITKMTLTNLLSVKPTSKIHFHFTFNKNLHLLKKKKKKKNKLIQRLILHLTGTKRVNIIITWRRFLVSLKHRGPMQHLSLPEVNKPRYNVKRYSHVAPGVHASYANMRTSKEQYNSKRFEADGSNHLSGHLFPPPSPIIVNNYGIICAWLGETSFLLERPAFVTYALDRGLRISVWNATFVILRL